MPPFLSAIYPSTDVAIYNINLLSKISYLFLNILKFSPDDLNRFKIERYDLIFYEINMASPMCTGSVIAPLYCILFLPIVAEKGVAVKAATSLSLK